MGDRGDRALISSRSELGVELRSASRLVASQLQQWHASIDPLLMIALTCPSRRQNRLAVRANRRVRDARLTRDERKVDDQVKAKRQETQQRSETQDDERRVKASAKKERSHCGNQTKWDNKTKRQRIVRQKSEAAGKRKKIDRHKLQWSSRFAFRLFSFRFALSRAAPTETEDSK